MIRPCRCGQTHEGGGSRCPRYRRVKQRTYGYAHQQARAMLRDLLPGWCGYGCGRLLMPGSRWVTAHVRDGDPTAGWVAACPACNERGKARGASGTRQAAPALYPRKSPRVSFTSTSR